ncbi:MAG: hypothetical protein HRS50_01665, partial [Mycoplasmataceae bacterium]|nr:hypothetical protein [Mycoplasmataceae bacterium]
MLEQTQIFQFILINLLSIFIIGIIYFVLKEFSRIWGKKFSNIVVLSFGVLLGIFVMIIYTFVSMEVIINFSESKGNQEFGRKLAWLSPSILVVILFATHFDWRLIFPLMFFQIVAFLITINFLILQTAKDWIPIIFELLQYILILLSICFLTTENRLVKKTNHATLILFFIYIFMIVVNNILYFSLLKIPMNINIKYFATLFIKIFYLLLFQIL